MKIQQQRAHSYEKLARRREIGYKFDWLPRIKSARQGAATPNRAGFWVPL
jgi:hypothetical protein